MTIAQLKEQLNKYPDDMEVTHYNREDKNYIVVTHVIMDKARPLDIYHYDFSEEGKDIVILV